MWSLKTEIYITALEVEGCQKSDKFHKAELKNMIFSEWGTKTKKNIENKNIEKN